MIHHSVIYLETDFLWVTKENGWWFSGGVPLFFILSGFMVYKSGERAWNLSRPWGDFFWNRFLRVAPALYLAGIGLIVLVLIFGDSSSATPTSLLGLVGSYALFAPIYNPEMLGDFGGGIGNSSLWTIPVEVSFYALVPILVLANRRFGRRATFAVASGVAIACLFAYAYAGGNAASSTAVLLFGYTALPFLVYFLIGILTDSVWHKLPHSGWLALLAILAYFAITIPGLQGPSATDLLVNAASALPLAYAAMWFGKNAHPLAPRFFQNHDLSFGAYLWHQLVINTAILTGFFAGWAGEWSVLAILAVTVIAAVVSHTFIEKPALRLKRYSVLETPQLPPSSSTGELDGGRSTIRRSATG